MKLVGALSGMVFLLCLGATVTAAAADFDGSKALICAPVKAIDCVLGSSPCTEGDPMEMDAPNFLRIDFQDKTVAGPKRSTPIKHMDKVGDQLVLQGDEAGMAWVIALDETSGAMTATLTGRDGAFVIFGSCTPLSK